ncbi:MAG: hypothetical protein LIP01_11835 [Tannerellaceae bacterium]|nr:hypothetical protein [Tannerellaceae bacterium]
MEEIFVLCEELTIPIYEVYTGSRKIRWQPLQLLLHDYSFRSNESNQIFDWSVDLFSFASRSDYSTFYITCNTFPDILNPTFDWIAKFSGLQWLLFNKGTETLVPLSKIVGMPKTRQLMERYISAVHSLKRSVYLVSYKILENYITDIRKFYLLGYLTKEDTVRLVHELEEVLQLFERVCIHGRLENGKEMEIYCTDLFLPSDMYILESDNINFGVFHLSPINPVITRSSDVCQTMTRWFDVWRRSATLISQSGTHLRQQFTAVQREVLEKFKIEMGTYNTNHKII